MFKKIDKFVFGVTLADYIMRFIMLLIVRDGDLKPVIGIISLAFSFVIFVRFFKDKRYTWKYFFAYVIIQSIISALLELMYFGIVVMGGIAGVVLGFLISGIVCSVSGGFLYGYFKHESYAKLDAEKEEQPK